MSRLALLSLFFAIGFAACSVPPTQVTNDARGVPKRIVSLDYCADQYVLKFADQEHILAVSPDAGKPFSYMRNAAENVPRVRPRAEEVLALKPDLIVRSYGGGPNAEAFFKRAGVPVLQVGWTTNIDDEEFGSIPAVTLQMAEGLGHRSRGTEIVEEFRNRLEAVSARSDARKTLYMTAGGVTSGPGSLIHDMLLAAGLSNYETTPGWRSLPLEQMVYDPPEMIAAAFFERGMTSQNVWTPSRHPVANTFLTEKPVIGLDGAWTACGGWFLMDAIEALAESGEE